MALGERDASGRRSPKPTSRTLNVDCDLLVAAVGESPDAELLEGLGIPCGEDGRPFADAATQATRRAGVYVGGDASRGPASIIAAIADGRRAAYAMLRASGIEPPADACTPPEPDAAKIAARGELVDSLEPGSKAFALREAERCLSCDSACLRCVEVCPNRANFALPVSIAEGFAQAIQILHVDELCNECGNCGIFCPFEGEPYRGKPTLFRREATLLASHNAGFAFADGDPRPSIALREASGGSVRTLSFAEWGEGPGSRASEGPMAALAREIYRHHPYLIGGRS